MLLHVRLEIGAEVPVFLAVREIHVGYYVFIAVFYEPCFDYGTHYGGLEIAL